MLRFAVNSDYDDTIAAYKARASLGPDYLVAWKLIVIMNALVGHEDWHASERMTNEPQLLGEAESTSGYLYIPPIDMGTYTPVVFENPAMRGLNYCLVAFGDFSVYRCDLEVWKHAQTLAASGMFCGEQDWQPVARLIEESVPISFTNSGDPLGDS